MSGMQGALLHTRYSSIQNDKYQVSHKYSCFSWWWAHSLPSHVEKRNKHNKKNCAPSWLYLQDYTGIHSQQNIKLCVPYIGRSHEDGPVKQTNKITESTQCSKYFFYSLLCDLCPHCFRRLFINSTEKRSSSKATSSLAGQGTPGILYKPIFHCLATACLLIWTYFPATFMHLIHYGTGLQIASQYKLGLLQSWTALRKLMMDKTNAAEKSRNVTRRFPPITPPNPQPPTPKKSVAPTLLPCSVPSSMCCANPCGHCDESPFRPFRTLCIICWQSAPSLNH